MQNLYSFNSWLARAIATVVGVGYSPIAPGTWGTAAAIPLAFITSNVSFGVFGAGIVVLTALSIWAAGRADRHWGTHDSRRVVVDEVVGYLIAVALVDRSSWVMLFAGFLVFRAFDIAKPPPVRWIDEKLPGGYGVVLDDAAAGLLAAPLVAAIEFTELAAHLNSW